MIIYHGGTDVIKFPRILQIYKGRDFGVGFYTTNIKSQAEKWAIRQKLSRLADNAILNSYEYDELNSIEKLNIKIFDDYSIEWLDLVISCRQDSSFYHGYDIVIGKVANDDVGETVQAVVDGLTSKEFALSKLVFMKANNQICFCSEKALSFLSFIESKEVQ
ncbi:MAG: DUF3990 domain-containing protein [Oscillospiraceae bacterium]|jgi:hypothetical protein|nr:DUF3990 domain-containing protein [Oscillospiraceae bacterium]